MKISVLLRVSAASLLLAASGQYRVTGKIPIGGEGGWDYLTLDGANHRLYVSHATKVVVVDVDAGKVVGEIPDTQGVHGIALAPKLNRGYTSNGRANNVTVFDLKTLRAAKQVTTGQNPDAILYEPGSNRIFAFNGRSNDATVINAASETVAATIPLGGKPEFSVSDGRGKLYVNIEDTHEVVEIDAAKAAVTKRYSLTGCEDPSGLAMDVSRRRLFSVCANKVMVVSNPDTGKVIATVPIGEGSDGAGFDASEGAAFSSNGEGTLTVVKEQAGKYAAVETVPTQRSGRTMTVDPGTHKIYIPVAEFGPAPAATASQPRPRPAALPNTFQLLVIGR